MPHNLLVILGPTACGKTRLAVSLAVQLDAEIISADSRQVYRGLDIGTGKDLMEYQVVNKTIPAHLLDILNPTEDFDVFHFQQHFLSAFHDITERGKAPILCGGTGMYLSSILEKYTMIPVDFSGERAQYLFRLDIAELLNLLKILKPQLHNSTDTTDKERAIKAILIVEAQREAVSEPQSAINNIEPLVIGINPGREIVKNRITKRLEYRLANGMVAEVERLLDIGICFDRLDYFGLEYRYIGKHLQGLISYDEMFGQLNASIHNFAKRQMTWFRRMEKHGIQISWLTEPDHEAAMEIIKSQSRG